MEHIEAILYHKIQESDFTNMYAIKKPSGGGGQTYIQAAGYSKDELDRMFKEADKIYDTPEYWDKTLLHPRKNYTFNAYVVGCSKSSELELAPRTGRKDYRICRQNPKYRHPAWNTSNDFPEPKTDADGSYIFEANYPGIIDNLYILLIKTRNDQGNVKFYASYVDSEFIPDSWPHGAGLEEIFIKSKRQGIIFFDEQYLRFTNDKAIPFSAGSAADYEIGNILLPENLCETSDDAIEYSKKDIRVEIDFESIAIEKVEPPIIKRKKAANVDKKIVKDANYERRHKNLKKIGDIGEELAIRIEKARLEAEGRSDLASKIEHVSKTIGDGLGYDIKSFEKTDEEYVEKCIEVKTTTGGKNKPFDISANEVEVSEEKKEHYCIYRFYGVSGKAKNVKYYEVRGSVRDNFTLEATSFKAYYKQ
ncbi:MAG: DUF3883 domain-containing protein [Clostridia bacterium]|nr:DUF3883 domain-containing protein [Clostridia bacterium]